MHQTKEEAEEINHANGESSSSLCLLGSFLIVNFASGTPNIASLRKARGPLPPPHHLVVRGLAPRASVREVSCRSVFNFPHNYLAYVQHARRPGAELSVAGADVPVWAGTSARSCGSSCVNPRQRWIRFKAAHVVRTRSRPQGIGCLFVFFVHGGMSRFCQVQPLQAYCRSRLKSGS